MNILQRQIAPKIRVYLILDKRKIHVIIQDNKYQLILTVIHIKQFSQQKINYLQQRWFLNCHITINQLPISNPKTIKILNKAIKVSAMAMVINLEKIYRMMKRILGLINWIVSYPKNIRLMILALKIMIKILRIHHIRMY